MKPLKVKPLKNVNGLTCVQADVVRLLKDGWFINHLTDTIMHPNYEVSLLKVRGQAGKPISKSTFVALLRRGIIAPNDKPFRVHLFGDKSTCTEYRLSETAQKEAKTLTKRPRKAAKTA